MRITNHRQGKISGKPGVLNKCRQTQGNVPKHAFLDENYNYVLNTKIMFTKLDFEF